MFKIEYLNGSRFVLFVLLVHSIHIIISQIRCGSDISVFKMVHFAQL